MKTKYVKVPVSERLPEKEGIYHVIFNIGGEEIIESVLYNDKFGFHAENTDCRYVYEWLEEVPDHSEEMLSLLEGIVDAQYNPETTLSEMNIRVKKAKEFLNKVKDNGK
ncbi:hypothetical protein CMU55_19295 [Elizabethkingia anophelis]|nr:hypothetical protein [Elizabethkingia anophelis]